MAAVIRSTEEKTMKKATAITCVFLDIGGQLFAVSDGPGGRPGLCARHSHGPGMDDREHGLPHFRSYA